MEVQAQVGWRHITSKLKSAIVTSSEILNISAWGYLFGSFYLFILQINPSHFKQTDKSIQRKYSFPAPVSFDEELVFSHNECAETLETKYIAWLWKSYRLTGDVRNTSHDASIPCRSWAKEHAENEIFLYSVHLAGGWLG